VEGQEGEGESKEIEPMTEERECEEESKKELRGVECVESKREDRREAEED
jgi:hypothetical protein